MLVPSVCDQLPIAVVSLPSACESVPVATHPESPFSNFPTTIKVVPSNVKFDSTVAFGAEPFNVNKPLSVVPVKDKVPVVPCLP